MKRLASLRSAAGEDGNAVDEDRMEALGDFEIVGRAERAPAEAVEIEPRDAADRLWNVQEPAEKLDLRRLASPDARQSEERRVERRVRLRAQRGVIDRRPDELLQPVVGARVELDDVEALLQEGDERKEQRAVEAVLVEVVGSDVGRRDDDDAGGKERGEEPPEDHRVGDVAHREFVEAEERGLARELPPRPGRSGRRPTLRPACAPAATGAVARARPP